MTPSIHLYQSSDLNPGGEIKPECSFSSYAFTASVKVDGLPTSIGFIGLRKQEMPTLTQEELSYDPWYYTHGLSEEYRGSSRITLNEVDLFEGQEEIPVKLTLTLFRINDRRYETNTFSLNWLKYSTDPLADMPQVTFHTSVNSSEASIKVIFDDRLGTTYITAPL